MQITFLAINYAPSVGGAQTLVRRVAEGLVHRHGHAVTVITTDTMYAPAGIDPGRLPVGCETVDGVMVQRLPVARRTHTVLRSMRRIGARFGRPIVPSALSYGPWGAQLGRAAMRAGRTADVVIGVSAPFTTVAAAAAATRRGGAAFVALPILHLGEWMPSATLVGSLQRAQRCVALTGAERRWLVTSGLAPDRVVVIPPGVDPIAEPVGTGEARAHLGLPDRTTVAVIGRLAAQKGIDTLLAACPQILSAHEDVTVLLAGSRTGWSGLDAALAALPPLLAERVIVRDDFGEDDRRYIFGAADVVVVPSREEAFGMVILEAWAAGRPVIASDITAIRSVIRDGIDGRLVPVGDAPALAAAVGTVLADGDLAASLAAGGRRRVADEFAWDAVVDRWNEELVGAVDDHGPETHSQEVR